MSETALLPNVTKDFQHNTTICGVSTRSTFSLLAVVVLYKLEPAESITLQTLLRAHAATSQQNEIDLQLSIVLVDNTPDRETVPTIPAGIVYFATQENLGLANAYNRAIILAQQQGCEWLLTLDQDTDVPEDFLTKIASIGQKVQSSPAIAAIVPQISAGKIPLSPNYFRAGAIAMRFPVGYTGVSKQPVSAFNSAATIRVDALQQMGGYDPYFWLDSSDAKMLRNLHRFGKSVFVAGEIQVEHEFSMKAMQQRISPWRYRHILLAESAFWDYEMNNLAGLERTLRLALRYLKHLRRGDNRELRSLTLHFLWLRLFRSRKYRLALFRSAVEEHLGAALASTSLPPRAPKISVCMAAYNGGHYIDLQLRSILPQLRPDDEIVIVDDCSTDDTRERIRNFGDTRIRSLNTRTTRVSYRPLKMRCAMRPVTSSS